MKRKLDGLTKEKIIKTTIDLIDQEGGASSVNLREVARIAGCSAPNIYNYFESLDDLLNSALISICEDYAQKLQAQMKNCKQPGDALLTAFRAYIEYAVEYPGRLNFFHFERLNFAFSDETDAMATGIGNHMAEFVGSGAGKNMTEEKMIEITGILHKYLLGELSEHITGRKKIENKQDTVDGLVQYCKKLYDILTQNL